MPTFSSPQTCNTKRRCSRHSPGGHPVEPGLPCTCLGVLVNRPFFRSSSASHHFIDEDTGAKGCMQQQVDGVRNVDRGCPRPGPGPPAAHSPCSTLPLPDPALPKLFPQLLTPVPTLGCRKGQKPGLRTTPSPHQATADPGIRQTNLYS